MSSHLIALDQNQSVHEQKKKVNLARIDLIVRERYAIFAMQIPLRRAQINRLRQNGTADLHLTAAGIERLRDELVRKKHDRPALADEVSRLAELGDFSENAEYQDAKQKLRRLNDRIVSLEDRIKHAIVIAPDEEARDRVALGSRVTLQKNHDRLVYEIVGPRESDPSRGRISHVSPLGANLLGCSVGESVTVSSPSGKQIYQILAIDLI